MHSRDWPAPWGLGVTLLAFHLAATLLAFQLAVALFAFQLAVAFLAFELAVALLALQLAVARLSFQLAVAFGGLVPPKPLELPKCPMNGHARDHHSLSSVHPAVGLCLYSYVQGPISAESNKFK